MKAIYLVALVVLAPLAFATQPVDVRKPAAPNGTVEILNIIGSVNVLGWDNPEIHIEGTLGDDVESLEFEVSGSDTHIEVVLPDGRVRRRNVEADAKLTIRVPKGSSVDVNTVTAPIRIENVVGASIEAESVSSSITISGAVGEVRAESVSSTIDISGSPTVVDVESVSGRSIIRGATRKVEASGTSGGVEIEAGSLEECDVEYVSGQIKFTGGIADGGNMRINNFSGNVTVILTIDVFGSYDLSTFSGRIKTNFGPEPKKTSKFTPGMEMRFKFGEGDSSVDIESFSGGITIDRK